MCAAPPNPHLNTWAPHAGPPGHAGLHAGPRTRSAETRAHIPPRGRADTHTQGLQTLIPAPTKIPPHPTPGRIQPYPPQPRTGRTPRTRALVHWPLPRSPSIPLPAGPWGPPTVLRSFPTIPSGALTCSGVAPGPHSVSAPRRAPARRLRTPRRPRLHNLEQVAAFPHFGGEGLESGWGEREARQLERPPRVLAPAALRSAPRAAATGGPSPPRLRGPRRLPRGAVEIHATSRPVAAGRATRAFRESTPPGERTALAQGGEGESFPSGQVSKSQSPDNSVDPSDSNALSQL